MCYRTELAIHMKNAELQVTACVPLPKKVTCEGIPNFENVEILNGCLNYTLIVLHASLGEEFFYCR